MTIERLTVRSNELRRLLRLALEAAEAIAQQLDRSIRDCHLRIQNIEAENPYADEFDSEVHETLRNLKEELLFCHTQNESRQRQITLIKDALARPDLNTVRSWRIDFSFMSMLMKLRDMHIHLENEVHIEERRAKREFGKLHPAFSGESLHSC